MGQGGLAYDMRKYKNDCKCEFKSDGELHENYTVTTILTTTTTTKISDKIVISKPFFYTLKIQKCIRNNTYKHTYVI